MAHLPAAELLATVAKLNAADRLAHLGRVGYAAGGTDPAGLDRLVGELRAVASAAPDPSDTHVALQTALQLAVAGGRAAALINFATDSHPRRQVYAASALTRLAAEDPDARSRLVTVLPSLSASARRAVIRGVRRANRTELADAVFTVLLHNVDSPSAARVLACCSRDVIDAHLAQLGLPAWRGAMLAGRVPEVALQAAHEALTDSPQPDVVWSLGRIDQLAFAAMPADVTPLYRALIARPGPLRLSQLPSWTALTRHDPLGALDLARAWLATPGRSVMPSSFCSPRALRRLATATANTTSAPDCDQATGHDPYTELALLVAADARSLRRVLMALPLARRALVWATVEDRLPGSAVHHGTIVRCLPATLRHDYARKAAGHAKETNDLPAYLGAMAYLPWNESREALVGAVRDPEPSRRAAAYRNLVRAAAATQDEAVVGEVLTLIARARNEQEPVRIAWLTELAVVPVARLRPYADVVDAVMRDAVEARDHSGSSANALARLTGRMLTAVTNDADPLLRTALAAVQRAGGIVQLPDLSRDVPLVQVERVVETLAPLIAQQRRERNFAVLGALLNAVASRVGQLPALQALLGQLLCGKELTGSAVGWLRRFLTAYLHEPASRGDRIRRLIDRHPAYVLHDLVWPHVARGLTDLLTARVLTGKEKGFPWPSGTVWIPGTLTGADHWTAAQLRTLGRYLTDRCSTQGRRDISTPMTAVTRLAFLPGGGRTLARAAASEVVPMQELALQYLPRTDDPELALATLMAHLGDDRARVAAYALQVLLRQLPRERAHAALTEELARPEIKLTARKALINAAPALAIPVADLPRLLGPTPHRDALGAVVSAALRQLNQEAAWELLDEYLSTTPLAAGLIMSIEPASLNPSERRRFAAMIADLIQGSERRRHEPLDSPARVAAQAAARAAMGRAALWEPDDPGVGQALVAELLRAEVDWHPGMHAARELVRAGRPQVWRQLVDQLVALDTELPDDASGPEDHAARRWTRERLTSALTVFSADDPTLTMDPRVQADVGRAAALFLLDACDARGRSRWYGAGLKILAETTPLNPSAFSGVEIAEGLTFLAHRCCAGTADRGSIATALGKRVGGLPASTEGAPLTAAVTALLDDPALTAASWLAVPVVSRMGTHTGWPPEWLSLLHRLRASQDAIVAEAADLVT